LNQNPSRVARSLRFLQFHFADNAEVHKYFEETEGISVSKQALAVSKAIMQFYDGDKKGKDL
jgi:hypothetical protein